MSSLDPLKQLYSAMLNPMKSSVTLESALELMITSYNLGALHGITKAEEFLRAEEIKKNLSEGSDG